MNLQYRDSCRERHQIQRNLMSGTKILRIIMTKIRIIMTKTRILPMQMRGRRKIQQKMTRK